MKTSLPTALIYGWDRFGEIRLESDVYHEENLYEKVIFIHMIHLMILKNI